MVFAKELEGKGGVVDLEKVQAKDDEILGKFLTNLIRFLIKVSVVYLQTKRRVYQYVFI
jgi:hypothetical protein